MTMDVVAVNSAICRALGLDPNDVSALTILLQAHDFPEVTVRLRPDTDEFLTVLKHFTLTPKEEP